ncbi:MAG: hypothetical protein WB902_11435, partial [Acetobacteraceae bacterium]
CCAARARCRRFRSIIRDCRRAGRRRSAMARRWTNGDAVLALPTLGGPTMLEIRIGSGGMAYVISAERERCVA